MCKLDVVRAWKDEDYRMSLSDAERRMLPVNPAGLIEISDSDLGLVGGGTDFGGGSYLAVCSQIGGCPSAGWGAFCTGCFQPCPNTGAWLGSGPWNPLCPLMGGF